MPLFVSGLDQYSRLVMDEEGVEAAAITFAPLLGALWEDESETIDFTLDRPFLFAVEDSHGLPLFMGVIDNL